MLSVVVRKVAAPIIRIKVCSEKIHEIGATERRYDIITKTRERGREDEREKKRERGREKERRRERGGEGEVKRKVERNGKREM
jgi:hypothetical protein